jgi:hypothetical protein
MCPHIMWRDRESVIRTLSQFGNGLILIDCVMRKILR